jgi:hypothetical protein
MQLERKSGTWRGKEGENSESTISLAHADLQRNAYISLAYISLVPISHKR